MQPKENTKHRKRLGNSQGFTALEIMIVFAAIAIVLMVSIPTSTMFLEKYRVEATYGDLLHGLELAVSEAQVRSSTVRMCPSSNGHTCRSDGNWNHGWLVFSDGNGNGTVQDIELIRTFGAPDKHIRIVAKGAVKTAASFTTTGLVRNGGTQTGLYRICHQKSDSPPRIVHVNEEGWVEPVPARDEVCGLKGNLTLPGPASG